MTFQTLGSPCGNSRSGCYGFRGVVGTCQNNNDGVNAAMTAYINGYDLTTVPWGILRSFVFHDVSDSTPDASLTVDSSNPGPDCFSQNFLVDNNLNPFSDATVLRSQAWWPAGSPFGALAVDSWNAYQTALICCTGVTGACGGNLIECAIPAGLPSPIVSNRCRVLAHLGLTPATIDAFYASQLAFGVAANYGTNWDPTVVCGGTADPFGDAP
jgi:hypothetical protein